MSGRWRVLVADAISLDGLAPLRDDPRFELVVKPGLKGDALTNAIAEADAVLVRSATRITRESLARAGRLKAIGRAGVGVDTIDVEAATERGIPVLTAPAGNTISAAELTMALLLALARRVPAADRFRAGLGIAPGFYAWPRRVDGRDRPRPGGSGHAPALRRTRPRARDRALARRLADGGTRDAAPGRPGRRGARRRSRAAVVARGRVGADACLRGHDAVGRSDVVGGSGVVAVVGCVRGRSRLGRDRSGRVGGRRRVGA